MSVPESTPEQQETLFTEEEPAARLTYRERRERKAERLRDWAAKRDSDASAVFRSHEKYRGDHAFNFQPGHIPERARVIAREERAFESSRKAQEMASRADEIERQAANAIYSDDPDAIERLQEKIGRLEAERDRIKAYNASCRKAAKTGGVGDTSLLDEGQRQGLVNLAKYCAYQVGKGGAMPAYELSNLGGNIKRLRDRLARLEREQTRGPVDRIILAKYNSECADCGAKLERGQTIRYNRQAGARCKECEQ